MPHDMLARRQSRRNPPYNRSRVRRRVGSGLAGPKGAQVRADWERDYVDFVSARLARWHRQAYLLAGDAHRADDIVQQTCTNLFVHWRRASSTDNPDSYVNAMLVKVFLNERRRGWAMRVRLTDTLPETPFTAA